MILLATNKRDITTDFIVLELRHRGIEFVRLNTEDLAAAIVSYRPNEGGAWRFMFGEREFSLSGVTAGYYRRPHAPDPPGNVVDPAVRDYCTEEWSAVLRSLWNALEGRWLNSPFSILRAEDKPRQLTLAHELGFNVPETLITNDYDQASTFVDGLNVIGKPLRKALIERGETGEVLFTSRLDNLAPEDRNAVALAPIILQREVRKQCDIRATVVGDVVFAAGIYSQDQEETKVDWRKGSRLDLRHEIVELPTKIREQCVGLARRLNLSFGAVDLILDKEGRYWFLEINPNGQWAWIERRTGLPISSAIVDRLVEMGH